MNKTISTVIEITDTDVKLLQALVVRGERVITACEARPIHGQTDEDIQKSLKELVRAKNFRSEDLIVVIPRRFTILKQMRLPSHEEGELRNMVGLQLVHQIPYALEDVQYDYHIIDKDNAGYSKILVIVVQREVIRRYMKITTAIGISPGRMTFSSFGLLGWLQYEEGKKLIESNLPATLINIDRVHSEICFCYNNTLLYSRSIRYGINDLSTGNVSGLIRQIALSLATYQKEAMGPAIKQILILSSLRTASVLKDQLMREFDVPIEFLTSFENVYCPKNIDFSTIKDKTGLSLSVGFGLLLSDTWKWINLLPEETHDIKKAKLKKKQRVACMMLILLTCGLGLSILRIELYQKAVYLKELERRFEETQPEGKKAEQKIRFVRFLNEEFNQRPFIADVIQELNRLTPLEISFRSLSLDRNGRFTMQGYAQTSASVNNFQSGLVKSPVFKDVNLQFATKRKIFNSEVTDFKIDTQLNGT